MKLRSPLTLALAAVVAVVGLLGGLVVSTRAARAEASSCAGDVGGTALTGSIDGAAYKIEVPLSWNGTLFLYSHGYVFPGYPNPATDVGDALTGGALLAQGYALAGSSYSQEGWALQQAFHDQIALLNFFNSTCGHPARTIAWGHSLGGIITAGLVQLYPQRFTAALPMCGVVAGGVGTWNQALDSSFAFDVLLAGNTLPIVNLKSGHPQHRLRRGGNHPRYRADHRPGPGTHLARRRARRYSRLVHAAHSQASGQGLCRAGGQSI